MVRAKFFFVALALIAHVKVHASDVAAFDLYDVGRREVEGDKYYSSPYGKQDTYYVNPSPEQGQYYREPTGKRTGYYSVPRGQTTYRRGSYDKGRFYIEPSTPYPGDKPHQEYQPSIPYKE